MGAPEQWNACDSCGVLAELAPTTGITVRREERGGPPVERPFKVCSRCNGRRSREAFLLVAPVDVVIHEHDGDELQLDWLGSS